MSYIKSISVDSDNPTGDAFGRLRVSLPFTQFDSKQLYDNAPLFWDDQEVSGASTSSTHSADRASSVIGVGAATAGLRCRQTFQRFNYQPGKSQLVLMTGVLDASGGGTDIVRRMGLFDDDNGIFLEDSEGSIRMVRRSHVTGSPVEETVAQAAWNIDPMDGTGPSGITVDWTKAQILAIDFEWLGVGRVRCALNIDGVIVPFHAFNHANVIDSVYMSTANLPLRYEIDNAGTGAASTMEAICCSVMVEGSDTTLGNTRSASTGNTELNANSAGTLYAMIGIRLKSTHIGSVVIPAFFSALATTSDPFEWALVLNPTVADTFTYNGLTNSCVEVAYGVTANTVTGGTFLTGGFIPADGGSSTELDSSIRLGAAIDGTVDELVMCVRPLGVNADVHGTLTWKELN